MFTKEILMEMFKKNPNRNFQIYTNIAYGRGINGVSYYSFMGTNYLDDDRKVIGTKSTIKGFADNYLVIEFVGEGYKFYYSGAKREIYVPYDNIVMVDFIADETHPLYNFKGEHNLNEI